MNGWAIVKDVGGFAQIRKLDCKMLGHNMLRSIVLSGRQMMPLLPELEMLFGPGSTKMSSLTGL